MARTKNVKTKAVAAAPAIGVDGGRVVLVGTYKGNQLEKWRGWYNWPISDEDLKCCQCENVANSQSQLPMQRMGNLATGNNGNGNTSTMATLSSVSELWLFKGTKAQRNYKAEFVGVKTREELVRDYGYPAKGKAHGDRYALFKTEFLYRHKNAPQEEAEAVIVRTKDFATSPKVRKQLKTYLESPDRHDPDLAKLLPSIITKLPPERLKVCEGAVQLDFDWMFRQQEAQAYAAVAATIAGKAKTAHKLTCVGICAGSGWQTIGLDMAAFEHVA